MISRRDYNINLLSQYVLTLQSFRHSFMSQIVEDNVVMHKTFVTLS